MERRTSWMTPLVALVLAAAGISPALANPETLERARRLLVENNPKQAYMELIKLEGQLAGNIDFDYLLGVAALDSGKLDDAIVAFERVLAVNPNHAGAQMDLSRAYFMAGSFDLAEAHKRWVTSGSRFSLISTRTVRYRKSTGFFVQTEFPREPFLSLTKRVSSAIWMFMILARDRLLKL